MLDIKTIRQNINLVKRALENRGSSLGLDFLLDQDTKRRALIQEADDLKAKRNQFSSRIAKEKSSGTGLEAEKNEMRSMSERIKSIDGEIREVEEAMNRFIMEIPNIPHESVPVGRDSSDNAIVRSWGVKPEFSFTPKDHWEIGEGLGILDFERGAKITGARFTLYRGAGARLERAIINFMLDLHTREHGYTEVLTPFMVNRESMTGTGQLPKFEEDLFRPTNDYFLIPTAEVPVTNHPPGRDPQGRRPARRSYPTPPASGRRPAPTARTPRV